MGQLRSLRMGNDHHCHCEERSDVAIPRYNFTSISVLKERQHLYQEIATALRPRNDTVEGTRLRRFEQNNKLKFEIPFIAKPGYAVRTLFSF